MEAEFTNLGTFAQALHSIIAAKKEVFTLAICNQQGMTRLIPVSVTILTEWRSGSQGILGCELAEGWMHRFKGRPKRGLPEKESVAEMSPQKEAIESKARQEETEISKIQDL
jgi:hypothetical protein